MSMSLVKKTTTTKKSTKKVSQKKLDDVLVRVPAELAFWTVDGQVFHSLDELAGGLLTMEGRVYRYHADKDHADFALWSQRVFGAKSLAIALKRATTAKAAAKVIRDYLKEVTV